MTMRSLMMVLFPYIMEMVYIPSRAALPFIHAAGSTADHSENLKVAMQGYLNHILGNLDIVNS
ncbi:hypothetical protein RHGRI_017432 [Rhododendron griersonianum]|uniref:Uncharacterized protein n=1 Tax=Rhododendron griersonianum TaxID=479676 RepID=A0AAV6JXT1_9ERIC|nr:hypothetical protein RHGRI_017432 [Rhododendron griersonianum]KAG5544971.1 hypothetical protein RHGRI_017432 [Rhododendron griersonianum]